MSPAILELASASLDTADRAIRTLRNAHPSYARGLRRALVQRAARQRPLNARAYAAAQLNAAAQRRRDGFPGSVRTLCEICRAWRSDVRFTDLPR